MNKKILLPILVIGPCALASCNGGIGKIKRDVYKTVDYSLAKERYTNIIKNQYSNPTAKTGIKLKDNGFGNASITFKYIFKGKGTMRYDDLSFHDVDAKASAGYVISWDVDKQILKVDGEQETSYFVKSNDKYYQCIDCVMNKQNKKLRREITNVEEYGDFTTYIGYQIDYYSTLCIPLIFSFTCGITGEYGEGFIPAPLEYSISSMFTQESHDQFKSLSEKYSKENKGYSLSCDYGSKDEKSVCTTLKGKGRIEDIHGDDTHGIGDFNVDLFASYNNNFVNQFEIDFNCNRHSTELDYKNYNVNYSLNMNQEIKLNNYTPEIINVNDYTPTEQ